MKIIRLVDNKEYLKEYFKLCIKEWGTYSDEEDLENRASAKSNKLLTSKDNNEILILGLVLENNLIGFISLFKTDGNDRTDLTPWYATMYVKKEYRGKGYSKVLNDALLKEAKKLGYKKVYLKSNLINYYEKFKAKYIEKLDDGENLYYINL